MNCPPPPRFIPPPFGPPRLETDYDRLTRMINRSPIEPLRLVRVEHPCGEVQLLPPSLIPYNPSNR